MMRAFAINVVAAVLGAGAVRGAQAADRTDERQKAQGGMR